MNKFEWTFESIAALIIVISFCVWAVCRIARLIDTVLNADGDEFDRRTITMYDVETLMRRDFGIDASECEKRWKRIVSKNPKAKPFDIYIEARDSKAASTPKN